MDELQANVAKFTTTTDDAVDQAHAVAKNVVQQIDDGSYGVDAWFQSMWQLFDIVARGSATHFHTAVAGPCLGSEESDTDEAFTDEVSVDPDTFERRVSMRTPLYQVGGNGTVPRELVRFIPPIVRPGVSRFRVTLTDPRLLGAFYRGEITLTRTTTVSAQQATTNQTIYVAL